jgi:hypothetical protein
MKPGDTFHTLPHTQLPRYRIPNSELHTPHSTLRPPTAFPIQQSEISIQKLALPPPGKMTKTK